MWKPVLLSAGALLAFAAPASAEKFLIQPGLVVKKAIQSPDPQHPVSLGISGGFKLVQDPDGAEGIKRGGACLVFQPMEGTKSCEVDSDCVMLRPGGAGFREPWDGYCVSANSMSVKIPPVSVSPPKSGPPNKGAGSAVELGSTVIENKTCWVRPGVDDTKFCKKSPFVDLVENKPYTIAFAQPYPLGPTRSVRWRVITCQNLVELGCAKQDGIEGVHRQRRVGTAKDFSLP